MLRHQIPFTRQYPNELDSLILSFFSFRDLNQITDANPSEEFVSKPASKVLKKNNSDFINLKEAKEKQDYQLLIQNFFRHVLPALRTNDLIYANHKDAKRYYYNIINFVSPLLQGLIRQEFYSFSLKPKIEVQIVRDCIFHYCQTNPRGAGVLLNQNIWKFWQSFVSDCLIEYGANVNVKWKDNAYPTLFYALNWSASPLTVLKLIEAGTIYKDFCEERDGIKYTYMLVAALSCDVEVLDVVVKKFPEHVQEAWDMLNIMVADKNKRYSCKFKDLSDTIKIKSEEKSFYSYDEIQSAKERLIQIMEQNNIQVVHEVENTAVSGLIPKKI